MSAMQKYEEGEGRVTFGQTDLEPGDIIMPRVKIVQAMSAEAQTEKKPAKVGDLFNTLTGENFGAELKFIPLFPFKQRIFISRPERRDDIEAVLGQPLTEGDGLKCRSFDMFQGNGDPGLECNECPLSRWRQDKPPICSETYNVAAMTELGDLVILSFSKSSAKVGKRLFSMLRLRHEAPWTRVFEMTTRKTQNDRGTFAVPDVTITSDATPPELLKVAQKYVKDLQGRAIDITPDIEEEPAPANEPF